MKHYISTEETIFDVVAAPPLKMTAKMIKKSLAEFSYMQREIAKRKRRLKAILQKGKQV